jgi:hypothetical protein
MLLAITVLLTSCSWPWESQKAASAPEPEMTVSFPNAAPELKAKAETQEISQEMQDVVPAGVTVGDVASLTMAEGTFPTTGAVLTFNLNEPLAPEHDAIIAHWNEEAAAWEPVPTEISADRGTLSARVEHFSIWGWIKDTVDGAVKGTQTGADYAYNGIGRVMGEKTDPPKCPGEKPMWADPSFAKDNMNAPVLWCVGTDAKDPDIMEVRMALNRGSAASITTAIKPAWAYSDLWENITPQTWAQMAAQTNASTNQLGETYLVQPLGEYHFGFHKNELLDYWYGHQTEPLIQVDSTLTYTLAGLMYQAVEGKAAGNVAGVFIMASLLECGGGLVGAAEKQSVGAAFGALTNCLDERKDAIAVATARGLKLSPGADWDKAITAGKNIGKIIRAAGLWYAAAKGAFTTASFAGDLMLEPILRQVIFRPSTEELIRYIAARKPQLKTYNDPVMGISFQYPSEWTASEPVQTLGTEGASVGDSTGRPFAYAVFGNSFHMSPCPPVNPYELLDSTLVTIPGMATTQAQTSVKTEVVNWGSGANSRDGKPVQLYIQVYSNPGHPAGTTKVCNPVGVIEHNGKLGTFSAQRGFDTVQEAKAYLNNKEYAQIKAMLASLRFL